MVLLRNLTDIQAFANDIVNGYIRLAFSDEHPDMSIACYTSKTQFAGHWVEKTTMLARGLVLKSSVEGVSLLRESVSDKSVGNIVEALTSCAVIARGMEKFFTVESASSEWGEVKLVDDDEDVVVDDELEIDFDAPASVADKLDGALGIGVRDNGDFFIVTKGSFESDEAQYGTTFMHDKHDSKRFASMMESQLADFTPLFEIISSSADHVVDYGDWNDICFLGLLNNKTGKWIPSALLAEDDATRNTDAYRIPDAFGFTTPKLYNAGTLREALALPDLKNHEGVVATLTDANRTVGQRMFKIKYKTFLELQALKNAVSSKRFVKMCIENVPADVIIDWKHDADISDIIGNAVGGADRIVKELDVKAPKAMHDVEEAYKSVRFLSYEAHMLFMILASRYDVSSADGTRMFAQEITSMSIPEQVRAGLFTMRKTAANGADAHSIDMAGVETIKRGTLKRL